MTNPDWNERYATDDLPWDSGLPEPHLVDFVRTMPGRGRALDVGCGTGTNALWLARQGFEVVGIDVSPLAIDRARAKLADAPLGCSFEATDFLAAGAPAGPFDLVFDRGCFHVFDEPDDRARFAARVSEALRPGGLWLSMMGSTEGPPREVGPPRRSLRDIGNAVEPALQIVQLRAVDFFTDDTGRAAAWLCLARRRAIPAQPSTRH